MNELELVFKENWGDADVLALDGSEVLIQQDVFRWIWRLSGWKSEKGSFLSVSIFPMQELETVEAAWTSYTVKKMNQGNLVVHKLCQELLTITEQLKTLWPWLQKLTNIISGVVSKENLVCCVNLRLLLLNRLSAQWVLRIIIPSIQEPKCLIYFLDLSGNSGLMCISV